MRGQAPWQPPQFPWMFEHQRELREAAKARRASEPPKVTRTAAEMADEVRRICARALATPPAKQEDDPAGLAERLWSQR